MFEDSTTEANHRTIRRMESGARVHVLVVDDDDFMRTYLCDALVTAGHRVTEARDGEEALVVAAGEDKPDLVMLDLLMPRRSGLDALPRLLALHPPARVIVVSSLDSEALIADALAAGAIDFVTKPFHPSEVEDAVARALQGGLA